MPNFHPFLIHFPIALLTLSLAAECAALAFGNNEFSRVGWWSQAAGTIALAGAAVTGVLAGDSVRIPVAAKPYLEMHQQIAFVAATVFAILLFWRIASRTRRPADHDALFLLVFAAGVIAMWAGAWYGGEMVYRFGTGVQAVPFP
jgi:uncharacterized membrane protein